MLYPEVEPYDNGMLDAGDGHTIYWEVCGNPTGKPVIVLHGGPGSGCTPAMRRFFDPDAYRIVLFDQRGCGRSMPHASAPYVDLTANTTRHLLADIERLRQFLAIEEWLVFGSSWGSTLALAYAEEKPWLVNGIVLVGVTMTRRTEIDWLYSGVRRLRPVAWAAFQSGAPESERDRDLVEAYHRLLMDPDPAIHRPAARRWCAWEDALVSSDPNARPAPARQDPAFQLAFARIVTHYFRHNAWLKDGVLLEGASKLTGIPGVMIHGSLDLAAPLMTAWELDSVWPDGRLVVVDGAGHSSGDLGMADAVIAATDEFAAQR